MNQEKIGFVGLGILGKAIADNIAKGGFGMICRAYESGEDRLCWSGNSREGHRR